MYASSKEGGVTMGTPNVCKVPNPPAPPVPTPFPSIGQCADADGSTVSAKVKIKNKEVLHLKSKITRTAGDEPGTLKGVVSGTVSDQATYKKGSAKVSVEGNPIVRHLDPVGTNGTNANMPGAMQQSPSQTLVIVRS